MKSDAPVACGRGYFSSEGSVSCTECPVGFYCPLLINSSPQPCTSGFYANETKSDSCKECDRGMKFVFFLRYLVILLVYLPIKIKAALVNSLVKVLLN